MMTNEDRVESVADAVQAFALAMGIQHEGPETMAGDMIAGILHWAAAQAAEGEDGRLIALDAARSGIGHYASESGIDYEAVERGEADELGPDAFVEIGVLCNGETWHSATASGSLIVKDERPPSPAYRYTPETCPTKHYNPGDDACEDCGLDLQDASGERIVPRYEREG